MFENIIGQTNLVRTLQSDMQSGGFPASVLLYGPRFSAKLSTALEIARILTCHEAAEWSCGCASCRKQRLLVHPNTVMMGFRYFDLEIAACADTLRRNPKTASQYLFVRAVRKLTRRFDPLLWEGEETRVRGLQPALEEIEVLLDELAPGPAGGASPEAGPGLSGRKLEQRLDKLQGLCRTLTGALSVETIPINQIRRAASWLHMTALSAPTSAGGAARKILILENVDRMYDASSNSLLKLLEEPPQQSCLILITTRRGALIPTVRSRLRPYLFVERTQEADAEVLKRIFHEPGEDHQSLRDFFLRWSEVDPQALRALSAKFIASVIAGGESQGILAELAAAVSSRSDRARKERTFALSFFEELQRQLRLLLREEALSPFRLERWTGAIREHLQSFEALNQQPGLVLESLYYTLRSLE